MKGKTKEWGKGLEKVRKPLRGSSLDPEEEAATAFGPTAIWPWSNFYLVTWHYITLSFAIPSQLQPEALDFSSGFKGCLHDVAAIWGLIFIFIAAAPSPPSDSIKAAAAAVADSPGMESVKRALAWIKHRRPRESALVAAHISKRDVSAPGIFLKSRLHNCLQTSEVISRCTELTPGPSLRNLWRVPEKNKRRAWKFIWSYRKTKNKKKKHWSFWHAVACTLWESLPTHLEL